MSFTRDQIAQAVRSGLVLVTPNSHTEDFEKETAMVSLRDLPKILNEIKNLLHCTMVSTPSFRSETDWIAISVLIDYLFTHQEIFLET
mgnify:FL=1